MGEEKIESKRWRIEEECAEERLRGLNQVLKAIRNVNQIIVREHDPERLLAKACDILVQTRGYLLVWIGRMENDKNCVVLAARAGRDVDYLDNPQIILDGNKIALGMAEEAIRTHKPAICQNIALDHEFESSKNIALAHGFASCLAVPMIHGDRTFGVLNVYADQINAFFDEEIALIEEVAGDLAFALQSIESDIKRKRAEEALQDSEERYRALFNSMTEGFALHEIICDDQEIPIDYRFIDINPAFERLTGLNRRDMIGRTQKEVLPDEDPRWISEYGAVALTGKPARFENYSPVLGRHFEVFAYRPAPHQFAVMFTDITKRKKMEEALRDSKDFLDKIINSIGDPLFVKDRNHRFILVNEALCSVMGHPSEEIIGRIDHDFFPKDQADIFWAKDEEVFDSGQENINEEKITDAHGMIHDIITKKTFYMDPSGNGFIVGTIRDITERKQAEEALVESKKRFQDQYATLKGIIESTSSPIFSVDVDYRYTSFNKGHVAVMKALYGAEIEIGKSLLDYQTVEEDQIKAKANIDRALRGERFVEEAYSGEEAKTRLYFEVSHHPITDVYGMVVGVAAYVRDVTKRKRIEEELARQNALLKSIVESPSNIISFSLDRYYNYISFNEAHRQTMKAIWGTDICLGRDMLEVIGYPEDREKARRNFDRALLGERFSEAEQYGDEVLGRKYWEDIYSPIIDQLGKVTGVTVFCIDVTERKLAESALRDSESKLAAIIEFLPDATFVIDLDGKIIAWNRAMEEMTGISRGCMIGQDDYAYTIPFYGERRGHLLDLLNADDKDIASKYQFVQKKGNTLYAEAYTPALNGGKGAYVWATGAPIFDNKGNRIGAIESIRDITERKKAERILQEQLNFLQQLIDSLPSPVFYKDAKGVYQGCNKAFETLMGQIKDNIVGHTVYELYPKDLADIYYEADNRLFQNPGTQVYEAAVAHADGSRHDVMFSKATYFDTEGNLAGLVGVILDITERKHMENALRESERRLTDIINFLPDPTFVIDKEGKIIAWNRAVGALTGIRAEYMLGKGNYEHALPFYGQRRPILIDLVLRPQEEVEKEYFNLKRDGGALVGEAYMHMLDSGKAYLLGVASALYDSQGNIVGAIESIKDITERKRSEEILKASLQEKEVLLKEVHHRVKNNLQIISSMLNIQASYIHDEDTRNALTESRSRVKSMALIHESLYRSENLARVNFADYIRNLLGALFSSYNADKMRIRPILDLEEVFLEIDQAIPCGLVLNELVTNCLKHAFPEGRDGEIQIELHSSNKMVMLAVKDSGIGLPKGFEPKSTKTMGLKIVSILVKQLNGTLKINSDKGTEFRITFTMS